MYTQSWKTRRFFRLTPNAHTPNCLDTGCDLWVFTSISRLLSEDSNLYEQRRGKLRNALFPRLSPLSRLLAVLLCLCGPLLGRHVFAALLFHCLYGAVGAFLAFLLQSRLQFSTYTYGADNVSELLAAKEAREDGFRIDDW